MKLFTKGWDIGRAGPHRTGGLLGSLAVDGAPYESERDSRNDRVPPIANGMQFVRRAWPVYDHGPCKRLPKVRH